MLRAASKFLHSGVKNEISLQKCMNISTTASQLSTAAKIPDPQVNPDILYTGVSKFGIFSSEIKTKTKTKNVKYFIDEIVLVSSKII